MRTSIAHNLAICRDMVPGPGYCVKSDVGGVVLADETQYHLIRVQSHPPGGIVRIKRIIGEIPFVETTIQGGNFPGSERISQSDDQVNHGES